MKKLQVFDPPMCCSSGVCGTNVDTKLITFASDLEWLKKQGIEVERYGLAFEPAAFANNEIVKNILNQEGNKSLPLVIVDDKVLFKGEYPDRKRLAEIFNIELNIEDLVEESVVSSSTCGPECDCHKSAISSKTKKIIFVVVLLIIAGIIATKTCCKVHAIEKNQTVLVSNKNISPNFGKTINSISQIKSTKDVAFVYIPSKNNAKISVTTKQATLSAKAKLNAKNIKVDLYTLKPTSSDYKSIASQAGTSAVLVVYNGKKSVVSGEINETRLLQAYMTTAQAGCGSGCPCHKK